MNVKEETSQRVAGLQQIIIESQADACIISTAVNQFYLLGFIFDGYLFIQPEGDPVLFVKRPNAIEGDNVIYIRKPEQIPDLLHQRKIALPKKLMMENDILSFSTVSRLQTALGMPELMNVSGEMRRIRSVKSEYELEQMRECANIHAQVYEQIPGIYRAGMTDIEFQAELEREMRLAGSAGIFRTFGENMDIFMGSVLAGDNAQSASPFDFALGGQGLSPLLPIGANGTRLIPGTTLMVDMAGNYRPWMSDMTRSFALGTVPGIAYKAHQVSIDICTAISATAKSGTPCADLYFLAEETVRRNGLADYFMGTEQQAKFVGHGVGLEINEPPVLAPRSKEILQPGMAIAIEPKFVLPGIGAVGIENTYIVRDDGLEKITVCEEGLRVL
ncbi:MAG TPA: aminopeptidase P family protein [Petrimonas sp.]|uniref:M24 family metallopeptidase n=1 Tax=Petrimonas sp. TaxID=2023866 RepID=UPI001752DCDE|nr:aminopeptidase P family protein [Petrimonas sp.]